MTEMAAVPVTKTERVKQLNYFTRFYTVLLSFTNSATSFFDLFVRKWFEYFGQHFTGSDAVHHFCPKIRVVADFGLFFYLSFFEMERYKRLKITGSK